MGPGECALTWGNIPADPPMGFEHIARVCLPNILAMNNNT